MKSSLEQTRISEVVCVLLFYSSSEFKVRSSGIGYLVCWLLICARIVFPFHHGMVRAVHKLGDSLDSITPVFWPPFSRLIMSEKRGTHECFAHVCNCLVTECMLHRFRAVLVGAFALQEL